MVDYFACVDMGRALFIMGRTLSWAGLTEREGDKHWVIFSRCSVASFPRHLSLWTVLRAKNKLFHTAVSFVFSNSNWEKKTTTFYFIGEQNEM